MTEPSPRRARIVRVSPIIALICGAVAMADENLVFV